MEDAQFAESLGVDTIGLVFHAKSPRNVGLDQACEIVSGLGGMMGVVALFHNAIDEEVWSVLDCMPQLLPQFHGDEPAAFCEQFGRPYLKAFGMGASSTVSLEKISQYEQSCAILLDANSQGEMGGTGHAFDWSRIPQELPNPLVLAGGLNPQNVAKAICEINPYAVDVSSGIESQRGVKDQKLMKEFVENVRGAKSE